MKACRWWLSRFLVFLVQMVRTDPSGLVEPIVCRDPEGTCRGATSSVERCPRSQEIALKMNGGGINISLSVD